MSYIHFKDIIIEGFGSIVKELKYKWERPGINIINGENGLGKTSILNALCWALYGSKIKEGSTITPWLWTTDEHFKGTMVRVRYYKDNQLREIWHCQDYSEKLPDNAKGGNRLLIRIDGKNFLDKLRDKNDRRKWVKNDLGWSFELFKSKVLFGQRVKRLVDLDNAQRNKVLEEAYEVGFITQARVKVEEDYKKITGPLQDLDQEVQMLQYRRETKTSLLKEKRVLKVGWVQNNKADIDRIYKKWEGIKYDSYTHKERKAELQRINRELAELKPHIQDYDLKNKDLFDILIDNAKRENTIGQLKEKVNSLKNNLLTKTSTCPQCGNVIKKGADKTHIKKLLAEHKLGLQSELEVLKRQQEACKNLEELISLQTKNKNLYAKLSTKRVEIDNALTLLSNLKNLKAQYKTEISELKAKINPIRIKPLLKEINDIQNILKEKKQEQKKLEVIEERLAWLLNDPLSTNGLKAFIFDAMLSKTNQELKKYFSILGFEIMLSMNLDRTRKDFKITLKKNNFEIASTDLSAGEKQLGDFAIALAINDTKVQNDSNILVFDEVFENLSKNNVELIGELLIKKAKDKSLHIITHNQYFQPTHAYTTSL